MDQVFSLLRNCKYESLLHLSEIGNNIYCKASLPPHTVFWPVQSCLKYLCLCYFSSKSQEDLLSIDFSQPTLSSTSAVTTSTTSTTTTVATTTNSQPNQLANFAPLSPLTTNNVPGKHLRQNNVSYH